MGGKRGKKGPVSGYNLSYTKSIDFETIGEGCKGEWD